MAHRLTDKNGTVVAIELSEAEMAQALDVQLDDLREWTTTIPTYAQASGQPVYRIHGVKELNHLKKRVALLNTRMSEAAVASVEEAELLDSYAALAADCPKGLTAHVWRSYGLVVLMQVRYGKMIDARELAERAGLNDPKTGKPSVEIARKHLRLLQSVERRLPEGGYRQMGGAVGASRPAQSWRGA